MSYVFISYSSKNQASADAMRNLLIRSGFRTWMAPGDIPPGSTYAKNINQAVRECACFLLMLSEDAQNSVWVAKEVERAINYRKVIIPVRIDEVILNDEFELYLSSNQVVAVRKIDENQPEIKQILASVAACCPPLPNEPKDPVPAPETVKSEEAPEEQEPAGTNPPADGPKEPIPAPKTVKPGPSPAVKKEQPEKPSPAAKKESSKAPSVISPEKTKEKRPPSFRKIRTLEGHTCSVDSVVFSPDGSRVVTASEDRTAIIWDAKSCREIGRIADHKDRVYSAAFSPDGKRIVTASRDGSSRIWDAASFREIGRLEGHTSIVTSAAFSPDGKRIVTASRDRTAIIWDADFYQEIGSLKGHTGYIRSAVFSPDGKKIITVSVDRSARIWDAQTFREIGKLEGHTNWVYSGAFSPDGRRIVTASSDGSARIWDAESLREVGQIDGSFSACYSPDGSMIMTDRLIAWDAETFRKLRRLRDTGSLVLSVAFSPDGRRIAAGKSDGTAEIWQIMY